MIFNVPVKIPLTKRQKLLTQVLITHHERIGDLELVKAKDKSWLVFKDSEGSEAFLTSIQDRYCDIAYNRFRGKALSGLIGKIKKGVYKTVSNTIAENWGEEGDL